MTKKLNIKKAVVFAIIIAYIIIAPILLWVLSVTAIYSEVQNNKH